MEGTLRNVFSLRGIDWDKNSPSTEVCIEMVFTFLWGSVFSIYPMVDNILASLENINNFSFSKQLCKILIIDETKY